MFSRFISFLHTPRALILAVWLFFNGWFLTGEISPRGIFGVPAGYRAVIDSGLMHRDSWMQIWDGDRIIGYSNSRIDIDEFTPGGRYLLFNETVGEFPIFGGKHRASIRSRIALDSELQLQEFEFNIHYGNHRISLLGRNIGGQTFDMEFEGPLLPPSMRITLPPDTMILPPTAEIAVQRIRPGRKTTLHVFNPLTMQSTPLTIEALRREEYVHRGRARSVTVLAMNYQEMQMKSWIDSEGNVLRQETPLGWILKECDPEEALDFMKTRKELNANNGNHRTHVTND